MQVDEERKGDAPTDLDIGGYENDEEDEREMMEDAEKAADVMLTLTAPAAAADSTLVICGCLHSQSLAKIMFASSWQEVGKATSTKTSQEGSAASREPKTIMTLYS